jgi:exopolysaccharide biosynthesis polyprenyl glycosylphosphotransferase
MVAGVDVDSVRGGPWPNAEAWVCGRTKAGAWERGLGVATNETVAVTRRRERGLAVVSTIRPVRDQYRRLYLLMALADGLSIALALALASLIRFGFLMPPQDIVVLLLVAPFATVALFAVFHLYDAHRFTTAEEFRRVVLAVSVSVVGLATFAFLSKSSASRLWVLLSWALALVLTLATRRLWHTYVRRSRSRGRFTFRTLMVGSNEEAVQLAETMERENLGFAPIGFLQTAQGSWNGYGPATLGHIRELRDLIRRESAECVFVASSAISVDEMKDVAKAVRLEGVEVRVTATLPEVLASRLSVQPVGGQMSLSLRPVRLSGPQAVAKRMFDVAVASVGLILTAPLWAVVALAIKLDSRGPVLFRQWRVGQRGRPFVILKFRTMENGADARVDALKHLNESDGPLFKLRDDPRITRVGKRLRRWSVDEWPQLWNVIRGHMSMVGPRPPLPEEVREYEDWQFDRLEVRPGITGLWQVSGRSNLSFDEYVRRDLFYIENWSLTYDLYIVAKTVPIVLSRRGAF